MRGKQTEQYGSYAGDEGRTSHAFLLKGNKRE
jgi:hypothetical protein